MVHLQSNCVQVKALIPMLHMVPIKNILYTFNVLKVVLDNSVCQIDKCDIENDFSNTEGQRFKTELCTFIYASGST